MKKFLQVTGKSLKVLRLGGYQPSSGQTEGGRKPWLRFAQIMPYNHSR